MRESEKGMQGNIADLGLCVRKETGRGERGRKRRGGGGGDRDRM